MLTLLTACKTRANIILLTVVFLTSACGGGNGDSSSNNSPPTNPDVTAPSILSVEPAPDSIISANQGITIIFDESINPDSLLLGDTMANQCDVATWTAIKHHDDTLVLTPVTSWAGGPGILSIDVTDQAGNPLPTLLLAYVVDDIPPTGNVSPENYAKIGPDTQLVINFSESIDTDSLVLNGTMANESDGGIWATVSNNNDTLILSPDTTWTTGFATLIVDVTDLSGNPLSQLNINYSVGVTSSATIVPTGGSRISNAEQIRIIFTESINTASLLLGGCMASVSDGGTWSTTLVANDTLIVNTTTGWPLGTNSNLSVTVSNSVGDPLTTINLIYEVIPNILYVRDSDGLDTNPGTASYPFKTISAAINSAIIKPADIHVAEGNYIEHNLDIVESVSLYGGYDGTDWINRDPNLYLTVVTDPIMSGGTASIPNTVFLIGDGISKATIIDGFVVEGGGGYSAAILISGDEINQNSSPVIQNNILYGGYGTARSMAILNMYSATPLIQNNIIFGGKGAQRSYGILSSQSLAPIIRNNIIHGGVAIQTSRAIDNYADINAAVIQNNTIYSGTSPDPKGLLIGVNAAPISIDNNIIFGGNYCIYEAAAKDPATLRNNNLSSCTTLYGDLDSGQYFDTICSGNLGNSDCSITLNSPVGIDNSNIDIIGTFVDIDGLDDNIDTIADNDWHLMISSHEVLRTGALDLSSIFIFDKDGLSRSGNGITGWSRGAYERD